MSGPVLLLRLRRDRWGHVHCAPDLPTAAAAAAAPDGAGPRLVTAGPAGTIPEWASTLARSRPAAAVLVEDDATRSLCELLAAALSDRGIAASRAEPDAERWRLRHLDGPRTELTAGSDPDRIYRSGAAPAALAAELGVPVGPAVAAELRHLAARTAAPMTVPLLGGPSTDWAGLAERLRDEAPHLASRGVRLRASLPVERVDPASAEALAAVASGGVTLVCAAERCEPERLRAALSALGAHRIEPEVRVAPGDRPERLAALLRAVPDAFVETDLAGLRGLASRGALNGCPPQTGAAVRLREDRRRAAARLDLARSGRYASSPVTAGAHDLWWDRADPVASGEAWLGAVVSARGTVWARRPAVSATAHVAVRDLDAVAAPRDYADPLDHRPSLAWIDAAAPILDDVDAAWRDGVLHRRLFDPGRRLAGLCRLGYGPCPAAEGRQLYVDADGAVRAGRAGPLVGKVGDGLETLRAAVRALPAAANGCRCRPEGMPRAERPWLARVLDGVRAVAALAAEHAEPFEPDAIRVGGCGGPLTHAHGSAPAWPEGVAVLRRGDRYHLHSGGRLHRLTPSLAAVIEVRLDHPDDAVELLAGSHRITAEDAARAVAKSEAALASAGAVPPSRRST